MRIMLRQFQLKDKETEKTWRGTPQKLGATLKSIRESTPSDFNWKRRKWKPMSRRDLANRVNLRLSGAPPITEAVIARIENDANVYEGRFLRLRQIAEALKLEFTLGRK